MAAIRGLLSRRFGGLLRSFSVLGWTAALLMALNLGGCPQPEYTPLFAGVTLEQVIEIATDPDLTEAEKTQALEDLGIDDPQIIEVILQIPWE